MCLKTEQILFDCRGPRLAECKSLADVALLLFLWLLQTPVALARVDSLFALLPLVLLLLLLTDNDSAAASAAAASQQLQLPYLSL